MGTNIQQESRRFKRWEIFEYALMTLNGQSEPEPIIIVDLSLGGFQCRSKTSYESGQICEVSITRPDEEPLVVQAEVRYGAEIPGLELHGTGMRFAPSSVEQRVALVNYIHTRFRTEIERISAEV